MQNGLGFLELVIVFGLAIGWGVLELVGLRLDRERKRREDEARRKADSTGNPEQ